MKQIALSILLVFAAATVNTACEEKPKEPMKARVFEGAESRGAAKSQAGGEDEREQGLAPEITGVTHTPEKPTTKDTISIKPEVEADNPTVVSYLYDWRVNGESVGIISNRLTGEYFKKGDEVVAVITPSDDNGEGDSYDFTITIENTPPQITSRPPSGNMSGSYRYQVVVRDVDDDEITYSLSGEPSGMTIDSSGLIEWPIDPSVTGSYNIEIDATDSSGDGAKQTFNLNLGE